MRYPTLLYCCKAKPYLHQDHLNGVWFTNDEKIHNGFCSYDEAKNGSVCFECETEEAFVIPCDIKRLRHTNEEFVDYLKRSCLTEEQLANYSFNPRNKKKVKSDVFFIHLENVRSIDPFPIAQLYKDEGCVFPLTRAPESYCFAYRKRLVEESEVNDFIEEGGKAFDSLGRVVRWSTIDGYYVSEKVLVFSVQSPWLCKIGNKKKDLEARKGCPKGLTQR